MLTSHPCIFDDYCTTWYRDRLVDLQEGVVLHRKQWEFAVISQVFHERGLLVPGKVGVGFAVGEEPLPSLFAKKGCTVVATDQAPSDDAVKSWGNGQLCGGLDILNARRICDEDTFRRNCSFRHVDMNHIPDDLGPYDFCWSSCAFEHLGSIDNGLEFVINSSKLLRPGGVAAHTTEYNCSSNDRTLMTGGSVYFRRRDFEHLSEALKPHGCEVSAFSWNTGSHPIDSFVDKERPAKPPFHLKLELDGYVLTSYLIIVTKH